MTQFTRTERELIVTALGVYATEYSGVHPDEEIQAAIALADRIDAEDPT